jgi:hypothetical protein
MHDFIFNSKPSDISEMFYCLKGKEDFIDTNGNPRVSDKDSDIIAAKCIQNKKSKSFQAASNNYSYYIRTTPNAALFNPIEKLSPIKDKRQFDFIDSTCKDKWMFVEVGKTTFDKYIKFLVTKNISWLKEANRDLK